MTALFKRWIVDSESFFDYVDTVEKSMVAQGSVDADTYREHELKLLEILGRHCEYKRDFEESSDWTGYWTFVVLLYTTSPIDVAALQAISDWVGTHTKRVSVMLQGANDDIPDEIMLLFYGADIKVGWHEAAVEECVFNLTDLGVKLLD